MSSVGVPPRRRRTGYRPGQLSEQMRAAVAAETRRLDDIDGPIETIQAVGDTFAAMDDALAELALPRLRAIAELRALGWSYDRIAEETGLSKPRVAQLSREALRRRL